MQLVFNGVLQMSRFTFTFTFILTLGMLVIVWRHLQCPRILEEAAANQRQRQLSSRGSITQHGDRANSLQMRYGFRCVGVAGGILTRHRDTVAGRQVSGTMKCREFDGGELRPACLRITPAEVILVLRSS